MKRNVSLEEISDGRLYTSNDMVKADCGDCEGCSACCHGMGESIILDPLDIYRLTTNLEMSFEALLSQYIELNVVDGVILPNLRMAGPNEACGFLDRNGRCSIHAHRPGICRLFPLGRYYEDGGFKYFLQTHECKKENRTKVKVKKWIDTPNLKQYESFVADWHNFLMKMEERVEDAEDAVAMLPQPYVTTVMMNNEKVRIALDVTAEWEALTNGESSVVTGVIVAQKSFIEENKAAVDAFLAEYALSTQYANEQTESAAELVEKFGIFKAAVAKKAMPYCNIVCIQGSEMEQKAGAYLNTLYEQAPNAVGGKLPEADFYYKK